jgi:hypothetical protein
MLQHTPQAQEQKKTRFSFGVALFKHHYASFFRFNLSNEKTIYSYEIHFKGVDMYFIEFKKSKFHWS